MKLDREDVKTIRDGFRLGSRVDVLAENFNVSVSTIYKIVKGESWKE